MDIIKNFHTVYDTFQSNLTELKITKTFQDLDNAKSKWTNDKEMGFSSQNISKGLNFNKFRAVKQMPIGFGKNESVMDDLESSKTL